LSPTHQKSLLVEAFNNATEKLVPSWNKELVVMVGLTANNTNSKVANARILVQGTFNLERKTYKAANFWEFEDPAIKFSLSNLDARQFKFSEGCSSDYLSGEDCDFRFKSGERSLSDEQLETLKFPGFALRAHVAPINPAGWANLSISLFPETRANLLARFPDTAAAPNFPGFNLFSGVVPMGPRADAIFPDLECGTPILPAIMPGVSDLEEFVLFLETTDILHAMSSLLRKAVKLDNKKHFRTLSSRWAEIESKKAGGLLAAAPEALWPTSTQAPVVNLGRNLFFSSFSLFQLPPPPLVFF
jgi:hypothetical protein